MKRIFIIVILLLSIQVCHAQTWDEWWRQRKTQIKYLLNQIAALKVYTGYLEKGYQIARDGTQLISDIKHGDFDLHNGYFSSLKSVNPTIKRLSKVKDIIGFQSGMKKQFRKLNTYCRESGQFTLQELQHINSVYQNLMIECDENIEELILMTTSGELEMKDDERLNRIEKIYADMKDKYSFTLSFCNETSLLAINRIISRYEIETSRKINGIK